MICRFNTWPAVANDRINEQIIFKNARFPLTASARARCHAAWKNALQLGNVGMPHLLGYLMNRDFLVLIPTFPWLGAPHRALQVLGG